MLLLKVASELVWQVGSFVEQKLVMVVGCVSAQPADNVGLRSWLGVLFSASVCARKSAYITQR